MTSNSVGGVKRYISIYTQTNARVTDITTATDQFINALKTTTAADEIYILDPKITER
ncbi:MAG: hypothetical protein NTX92_08105 [Euryarchaeota archaeon]|nr:hypothetical protein [Euryarchaeota archaeon]